MYNHYLMADAIIVPGRGVNPDGSLPADPISRVKKSVELYNNGDAPVIVMSGGASYKNIHDLRHSEAFAMKRMALSLGVPENGVLCEDRSTHTVANAFETKKKFAEIKGWKSLIVVASDEHIARVEYVFRKVYGHGYTFRFVTSERVIDEEQYTREQAHEAKSMKLSQELLGGIRDGDDQEVLAAVRRLFPQDPMTQKTDH